MRERLPVVDLFRSRTPLNTCSYLSAETSSLEYRVIPDLTAEVFQFLLERGWRRQGLSIFRPACPACRKCVSLRVDVQNFQPTKSQRRALRRNEDVTVSVHPATVSERHMQLFNSWHADMHLRSGWSPQELTASDYFESFLSQDCNFGREFRYHREGKLVGVGLVDVVPEAASSVYFYHDPAWRSDSPGTFSALQEIEWVRQHGGKWLYLGYWITECPSMNYKNRFRPYETLAEYVGDDEEPSWSAPAE